ncbi:MAG: hypothetical protein M9894_29500 [Planctomycetes bacterium]|nr:hypothetical protein [Planctomycetota bacterium]
MPAGATQNANARVLLSIDSSPVFRRTYQTTGASASTPIPTYTFTFRTTTGLPADGTLELTFDNRANTFGLGTASVTGWSGIDGGFTTTVDDSAKKIYLVRDGTGTATPGGRTMVVSISNMRNPAAAASNYTIDLQTRDAPFTGSQVGTNVLDSTGTNRPHMNLPQGPTFVNNTTSLDFKAEVSSNEIGLTVTAGGTYPNLPKGASVTFSLTGTQGFTLDGGDKFVIAFPPFGPDFGHLGGGFTITSAPGVNNYNTPAGSAPAPVALFGSSTPNAVVYTANGNNRTMASPLALTVTLPDYEIRGARIFIFHNITRTNNSNNLKCYAASPTFNVVDTGNLVVTGDPASLNGTDRVGTVPTHTPIQYDVEFTHTQSINTNFFIDVTTAIEDSIWTYSAATNTTLRSLSLSGIVFGATYGVGGAGTNTNADGQVTLRYVRGGSVAADAIEVRNGGTLLASGTVGTTSGLGYVNLVANGASGVNGSVVIARNLRGAANEDITATPVPVTFDNLANVKPHSLRLDASGRMVFRFQNTGAALAGGATQRRIRFAGNFPTSATTTSTLPGSAGVTVQLLNTTPATIEGPTTAPLTIAGQALQGPGTSNAPRATLSATRTYEAVATTTFELSTHSQVPPNGAIVVSMPSGFVLHAGLTGTWRTDPRSSVTTPPVYLDPDAAQAAIRQAAQGALVTADFEVNGQDLIIRNTGTTPVEAGFHRITLTGAISANPPLPGDYVATISTTAGDGPTPAQAITIQGHTVASTDPILVPSLTQGATGTGASTTYVVQFVTKSDIPDDGVVRLQLFDPTGTIDLSAISAASGGNTSWASSNGAQVIGNFSIAKSAPGTADPIITITRTAGTGNILTPGTMTLTFTNAIANPRRGNRDLPVQVETRTAGATTIDQSAQTASAANMVRTTGGAVTGVTLVNLSNPLAGAAGASYRVTFNTQSRLPGLGGTTGGRIIVTFPGNTDVSSAGLTVNTAPAGGFTPTVSGAGNVLTITHGGATDVAHGAWDLTVTGVRNASQAQTFDPASGLRVHTLDDQASGYAALDAQAGAGVTLTGGDLTNVALSSPLPPPGAPRPVVTAGSSATTYTFDFRLNADVVTGNAIEVTFPLGFNVSNVSTTPGTHVVLSTAAAGGGPYTPTTNYTVSLLPDNLTVRLVATATIDAATTPFLRLALSNVRNTTVVATHQVAAVRTLNTGNGVTVDAWPSGTLPQVDVDGAGFAASSVTYAVAPAAADQQSSTHTFTFQMGSTLPANGLVTLFFEDAEVKLANSLTAASTFTGGAGEAITWAGIDGGYRIRAIQRSTSAGVSRTGLVLERDPLLGANGDTSPVRHAIQLVDVVTNTSLKGDTRYRIEAFRNPATSLRPRLRTFGASGRLTLVSTSIAAGQVFDGTDLTGAIYLEVTGTAGNRTITAYRDQGRDASAQIGQVVGVADTQAGVTIPCTVPGAFDIVVDVNALTGGEVDVLETLWRIDPPQLTGADENRSGPATIVESSPQSLADAVSPPAKGAASTHTITFSTPVIVRGSPAHVIRVQLQKGNAQTSPFSFANVAADPATNLTWTVNAATVPNADLQVLLDPGNAVDGSILWIRYIGAADLPAGNHSLTLRQVVNSNDEGTDFFATVSMYRQSSGGPPAVLAAGDRVLAETNTPNFSLSGAQLTNVTASPTETRAAQPSGYTLQFRSLTQIPSDGQVRVVFPRSPLDNSVTFDLSALDSQVLGGAVGLWEVDLGAGFVPLSGAVMRLDPADGSDSTLVISRKDGVGVLGDGITPILHRITIAAAAGAVNVDTKGSYALAMSTHSYGGADQTPGSIIEGPNDSSPPFNLVGDQATVTTVVLNPAGSGAAGAQHTVTFTTSTRLPADARLVFTYDAGADAWANGAPGFDAGASSPGLNLTNFSFAAGVLSCQRDNLGSSLPPGTYFVALTGFTNSTNRHRQHQVTVETRDALNVPIDAAPAVPGTFPPRFIVQPGQVANVLVVPSPATAGNTDATHPIDLTTTSAIAQDARLLVRYSDPGFDLSAVGDFSLTGVGNPALITLEQGTSDGRAVIALNLPADLAPATRTLTLRHVRNTANAASNHTVKVVVLAPGAAVAVNNEPFGAQGNGDTITLASVNGQPPVVVPGSVTVSTGVAFVIDEVAGTITFPNGSAAGTVSYQRYPEVVAAGIGSPVPVDLGGTSAQFAITGGPATQVRFENVTVGSVRNRLAWPNTFRIQLLDAAGNETTNTGGQPIDVSFTSAQTGAGATLQWDGGVPQIPTSAISATGQVVLDLMSFRGRLTGVEAAPGFNTANITLTATIGGTPLTLAGAAGSNVVKVIPGNFTQVAWPASVGQQTVDAPFTGSLLLQAVDADGNRPPTPGTTPNLRVLPRTGPTTGAADEVARGSIINLGGGGDQIDGAQLDTGAGTFNLVGTAARFVGPAGDAFFHVHRASDDGHVTTVDTTNFQPTPPLQVTFAAGQAARVEWTLASAFGRRVSGSAPATSIPAGSYSFTVALNGDNPAPTASMVVGAITSDGPAIAAALQTAIRQMTASSAPLQKAYSQARVAFSGNRYVVVSGVDATAGASTVGSFVDVSGPTTLMDALKLVDGQGSAATAGDPAAIYRIDGLFPTGAAVELLDAGGNPTTNIGSPARFLRIRVASTFNPGFDRPRLSYEAPAATPVPDVMVEATPDVDYVDLLPPGATTNLGNVLRYGGGHNNGRPMRLSVRVASQDGANSPRAVQSATGTPLVITKTAAGADWTPGDLVGKTILFTGDGPAVGRRAVIAANTATTITITEPLAPAVRVLTGTVNVVNGSSTVTGAGTSFQSDLLQGHWIEFSSEPGVFYVVQTVTSNTELTLTFAYNGTNDGAATVTRGGAPGAGNTFEVLTLAELPLVSSQVDGVDNTVVFTPAKVSRVTLQGFTTFRVAQPSTGSAQAQDRYGNPTNDVGAGAVFGLATSPTPVGAPFSATNLLTGLPDGGGTSATSARFTNGVATISPEYRGAALADGSQTITIGVTVDGAPVTVQGATYNVDAGDPLHVEWVGLNGRILHAGRPLNDSAAPTGLGPAGVGPWQLRLFDAAGNAVEASDVPAVTGGIRVDVVSDVDFPKLDALADPSQSDAVAFGAGGTNLLQSAAFTGNTANIANMRFNGRSSQNNGQSLRAVLVSTGGVETNLIPVTLAPPANPVANPAFTVRPGALAHFHWALSNTLVQQPSQPLDPLGTYEVHAHDAFHNRLGAAGETYEARPNTPIAGSGFDLTTHAGTTPELVYVMPINPSDPGCRLNFGATDPGAGAPLLGRVRLDKGGAGAFAWSNGTFRLGPSPQADLRYFGINGDVQLQVDVSRVTPGRTIGALAGTVAVTNGSNVVDGAATQFTTQVVVGERIEFASQPGTLYEVASISGDLQLVLTSNYTGTTNLNTTGTTLRPILGSVTNAANPGGATTTDNIRIGAGAVDHFWFQDATALVRWDVGQTNDTAWNANSAGSQLVARDVAGNTINTYTTEGEDVRLITYAHHMQGTATAYDGTTFVLTYTGMPTAAVTPDNVILVNRRTGAVAKVVGINGQAITLEAPGFRFGANADNTLVLNTDVLDVLVRLDPLTWRFSVGDNVANTNRNGGVNNDQPHILRTQFTAAGGTFSINSTLGGAANGWRWTGQIPAGGTIIFRPVINTGLGQFEHRGVRVGSGGPGLPARGGVEVPIGPGTVTAFQWSVAGVQQNGAPFAGTNTLTAVDVSGNVNTTFNGTTNLTVSVAAASRVPTVGTLLVEGPASSTTFTTNDPAVTAAVVGRTVHLFDNGGTFKTDAVIVAYDSVTRVVTTTDIAPLAYVAGGTPDRFAIDPFPPGNAPTLTPTQITGAGWTNGVANLSAGGLGLTYRGVANGLQVTVTATSGSVTATSGPITLNPGAGTKVALLYRGLGLGVPDELLVEGTPNGAGGNPSIVQAIVNPAIAPNQALAGTVVVLDANNNRLTSVAGSTASVLSTDPFGTQGPQGQAWDGTGRVQFSVQGRTVTGLTAPPATRATPASWSLQVSNTGGFATPAGVATRTFRVVTDGVKRVEYIFDHADAATGTFGVGDTGTATTLQVGAGTPFSADMVGMVLVNTTNGGAYGRITAATTTQLTFNALQGADPTRAQLWLAGDSWRVVPMYRIDGMTSSTPGSPGVEGSTNTRVLTVGTAVNGRVLLLDSGNNVTAGPGGDNVTVNTTDPFDVHPSGTFVNGVFSFALTARQAAHNTGQPPLPRDENDLNVILNHTVSIAPTGASFGGGGVTQQGASNYQAVPGAAAGVVLVVAPPSQRIRRGDATTPLSGTPPLQTAGAGFLVRAYVVDQHNNPVDYTGQISFSLPGGGTAGPFAVTEGDTGNVSFLTLNRSGHFLQITPQNPVPNLTTPTLRPTDRFDVKPGAPAHGIVYVSVATGGGGVETLNAGQSAVGDPPGSLTLSGGTLRATAGEDNVTITVAVTDALSNPVLLHEMQPAGDRRARITTSDPNNSVFEYDFTGSTAFFQPTHTYGGFPAAGTPMATATLARTITLTRAQLQHVLDIEPASLTDDLPGAITAHRSRPIRIDPAAVAKAVIVLPGQTLNTGAKTGQPVFQGSPQDQVEGVEFPVRVFAVDAFHNIQYGDSTSTLDTLVTDEGTNYVGGLGFRLSAEGAATLVNSGQLEFTDLNGLVIAQLPFANASTGADVASRIRQAVREQTIATSEATIRFDAFFLPEFSRYLLVSGAATKPAQPTSRVAMGAATTAGLQLVGAGSNGRDGAVSPAPVGGVDFASGVLAFTVRHAVAADIHFLDASLTINGGTVTARSENYRVLEPDFAIASVTMLDDGAGKIDRARLVFTLGADPNSIAGAAGQFELTQTRGGQTVTLRGSSASLLSTVVSNDTIDVLFNGKLPTTSVDGLTLTYTRPLSGGLRGDPNTGGRPLDTVTRTNVNGQGEIRDGAVPALVNVTREDTDGDGNVDLMRFVFSEDVGLGAGAGFHKGAFGAGDVTTAAVNDGFLISIDGEAPQAIALGDVQTGTSIAAAIQAGVRGLTAANPLKQRAYDNFTATYDARTGRFLLRSGVGLQHDGARLVLDWASSRVVVTPQGGNNGAAHLGLGAAGFERQGFGDAQAGFAVSTVGPPMEVVAGTSDQLRLQLSGDTPRLFSLSITVTPGTTPSIDDRGRAIAERLQTVVRQIVSQSPSLQPAYSGFTALWDAPRQQLVLIAGNADPSSRVEVLATGTPQDASANLGLDNATSHQGSALSSGQARPLDDLIVLSQDGVLNLLAGRTHSDVVVSGGRIDVRLTNVPGAGTAMPRFAWIDAGDGGFVQDRAAAPRALPESTNVSDLSARFAVVLDDDGTVDGVLRAAPGDVLLDASQSLPPLLTTGGRVRYRWEQTGTTDPGTLTIDNGDGNPPGQTTADHTSPLARILGVTAPGDYNLRLIVTVVDDAGDPLPNAFTDGQGQVVRDFRVRITDEPPIAIIAGPNPLVVNGPVRLDGTQSLDPNGGTLNYLWTAARADGTTVVTAFDDASLASPMFSPPEQGVFTIRLYVATAPAIPTTASPSTTRLVSNGVGVPYADPGPDLTGRARQPVVIDASLSQPPGSLTFQWSTVASPTPVPLSVSGATVQFTPPVPGLYRLRLVVRGAGGVESAPRDVSVMVVDDLVPSPRAAPVARPRLVGHRRAVFLAQAPASAPTTVVLDDGQEKALEAYLAPADPAPSSTGLVSFEVIAGGAVVAKGYVRPPAGRDVARLRLPDGTSAAVIGFARSGDTVMLDGTQSQSTTSVISEYTWRQVGGPFAFTSRKGGVFAVTVVTGLYELELTVEDSAGLASRPAALKLPVLPQSSDGQGPPAAVATAPARAAAGQSVQLDGSSSVSRAPGTVTYRWEQVLGPPCALSGETSASATASPQAPGVYAFRLRVVDANGVADVTEVAFGVDDAAFQAPVVTVSGPTTIALAPGVQEAETTLSAAASTTGGGTVRYLWTQLDGSPVFLDTTAGDAQPRLRLRAPGWYRFAVRAVVRDQSGAIVTASAPATAALLVTGGQDMALVDGAFQKKSSGGCALAAGRGGPGRGGLALLLLASLLVAARGGRRA